MHYIISVLVFLSKSFLFINFVASQNVHNVGSSYRKAFNAQELERFGFTDHSIGISLYFLFVFSYHIGISLKLLVLFT